MNGGETVSLLTLTARLVEGPRVWAVQVRPGPPCGPGPDAGREDVSMSSVRLQPIPGGPQVGHHLIQYSTEREERVARAAINRNSPIRKTIYSSDSTLSRDRSAYASCAAALLGYLRGRQSAHENRVELQVDPVVHNRHPRAPGMGPGHFALSLTTANESGWNTA